MLSIILSSLYLAGWSVIPIFDKYALKTITSPILTWFVFFLSTVFMTVVLVLFTEDYLRDMGRSFRSGYAIASAVSTCIVYNTYYVLLNTKGVVYIVLLQPVLLITQTLLGVTLLKEPLSRWNILGMVIILLGILVFNLEVIASVLKSRNSQYLSSQITDENAVN